MKYTFDNFVKRTVREIAKSLKEYFEDAENYELSDDSEGGEIDLRAAFESYGNGTEYEEAIQGVLKTAVRLASDYDFVKERLSVRLLPVAENAEMLNGSVWRRVADLAATYRFVLTEQETDKGRATVSLAVNALMVKAWGVSEDQMTEDAHRCLERDGYSFYSYLDMMPILSNPEGSWGASAILIPEAIEEIKRTVGEEFYLLPSSVHEWIVCDDKMLGDLPDPVGALKSMIFDVNNKELEAGERLSYNLYKFDTKTNKLSVVS